MRNDGRVGVGRHAAADRPEEHIQGRGRPSDLGYAEVGITVPVEDGDRLTFTGSDVRCRFARVRPRNYFHAMLVPKLQRGPILPPLPPDTPSPHQP